MDDRKINFKLICNKDSDFKVLLDDLKTSLVANKIRCIENQCTEYDQVIVFINTTQVLKGEIKGVVTMVKNILEHTKAVLVYIDGALNPADNGKFFGYYDSWTKRKDLPRKDFQSFNSSNGHITEVLTEFLAKKFKFNYEAVIHPN